jgi:SpoVK/Ycf46/Vps4 family AAA+-type ATPase
MGRQLQAREFHLQRLQLFTMDKRGNSVLSNAVTLDSLVPLTRKLTDEELKQCVINAIRNALHRLVIEAPHVQALPEVDNLVTMGDFLLALRELNLLQL